MDGPANIVRLVRRIPWFAEWSLEVGKTHVTWTRSGETFAVDIADEVTLTASGLSWVATLVIGTVNSSTRLRLAGRSARALVGRFESMQDAAREARKLEIEAALAARQKAGAALSAIAPSLLALWAEVRSVLSAPRYLAYLERRALQERIDSSRAFLATAREAIGHAASVGVAIDGGVTTSLSALTPYQTGFEAMLAERNDGFVEDERKRWKTFFEICEATPMTREQVTAILTEEERTQLIAAAGSGKTSTIIAKVAYLLASGIAEPEEILCLAFNKAAAGEMARRIRDRLEVVRTTDVPLPDGVRERLAVLGKRIVTSKTFHSFGLGVVIRAEGRRQRLPPKKATSPFRSALARCLQDEGFARDWWQFHLVYQHDVPDEGTFKSPEDYAAYLENIRVYRLQSEGILTLGATRPVRSLQEAAICNWLYLMGVDFEYEADFAAGSALRARKRGWPVDFTYRIPVDGRWIEVVHEHFGVNAKGKAPAFFDDPAGYERDMQEKQAIMASLDSRHFWTTSGEWYDGTLLPRLEATLHALGVVFAPRPVEQVEARLKSLGRTVETRLVEDAVSQIRSNGWTEKEVMARVDMASGGPRAHLFAALCWTLAGAVNDELQTRNWIDFDEMVRRSLGHLERAPARIPFRRIIVDEFQDTAPGRGRMVALLLNGHRSPRLMAVGDDWQAINRFAGSDLRYFSGFEHHFGLPSAASAKRLLTKTFRTNQGLADIAGRFVRADVTQMPKPVTAQDKSRAGVVDLRRFKEANNVRGVIDQVLEGWVASHANGTPRVFILSRYGEEKTLGLGTAEMKAIDEHWADRVVPPDGFASMFSTLHKSKGMQADYVLILGLFENKCDIYAYPNGWHEDPLGQLFLPPREGFADAEDRRLLYVGLTRAKHKVALVVHDRHPSRYAVELMKAWKGGEILLDGGPLELCEVCGERWKTLVVPRNGAKPFMGCPEYRQHPAGRARTLSR